VIARHMKWSWLLQEIGLTADSHRISPRPITGSVHPGYTQIRADPEEEIPGQPRPSQRSWWLPPSLQTKEKAIQVVSAADPEISPEPPENPELQGYELRWQEMADRGELCVYTCLSFKIGGRRSGDEVDWNLAGTLTALIALQVLVPVLMLFHELKALARVSPSPWELEFRFVGFILYLYSIRRMYNDCVDECRGLFLQMAFQYNLPFTYVWPLVLGELINTFCAFTLCLTLFTVFCQANHLQDLVINCIAINFIGNVDSEFCSQDMKEFAVVNFEKVARERFSTFQEDGPESICRSFLERSLAFLLWFFRTVGTVGFGTCLSFVFLLSLNEAMLCQRLDLPMIC